MSAHPPPVPPANQTDKGPGPTPTKHEKGGGSDRHGKAQENTKEQGEEGNMHQNVTYPGVRGDR